MALWSEKEISLFRCPNLKFLINVNINAMDKDYSMKSEELCITITTFFLAGLQLATDVCLENIHPSINALVMSKSGYNGSMEQIQ